MKPVLVSFKGGGDFVTTVGHRGENYKETAVRVSYDGGNSYYECIYDTQKIGAKLHQLLKKAIYSKEKTYQLTTVQMKELEIDKKRFYRPDGTVGTGKIDNQMKLPGIKEDLKRWL